jgi:hypothetical protein
MVDWEIRDYSITPSRHHAITPLILLILRVDSDFKLNPPIQPSPLICRI